MNISEGRGGGGEGAAVRGSTTIDPTAPVVSICFDLQCVTVLRGKPSVHPGC